MNGDVKASPLYKQSLEQSIAKMEAKADPVSGSNQLAAANIPTGANVCPMTPLTQTSTCEATYCGTSTCSGTCGSQSTCAQTCMYTCSYAATCAGWATCFSTCANTCVGGSCEKFLFDGSVWWVNDWNPANPASGTNWGSSAMYPFSQSGDGTVTVTWDHDGVPYTVGKWNKNDGTFSGIIIRPTTFPYENYLEVAQTEVVETGGQKQTASAGVSSASSDYPVENRYDFSIWLIPKY